LKAVEKVDKEYSSSHINPYSNIRPEKIAIMIGLKLLYLTQRAPFNGFDPENIKHLHRIWGEMQHIHSYAIKSFGRKTDDKDVTLGTLLGTHLLGLKKNTALPNISENAIHFVFLGIPPNLLTDFYEYSSQFSKWDAPANKAAVHQSASYVTMVRTVASTVRKKQIKQSIQLGLFSTAMLLGPALIGSWFPELLGSYQGAVKAFGVVFSLALKATIVRMGYQTNGTVAGLNEFAGRIEKEYETSIRIAKKEDYAWKSETIPKGYLTLCKLDEAKLGK
jgi:hypothetical protein